MDRARLAGQILDFRGHDTKALPGFTGACGFDRGIQRQQVCLAGDCLDEADHVTDAVRRRG